MAASWKEELISDFAKKQQGSSTPAWKEDLLREFSVKQGAKNAGFDFSALNQDLIKSVGNDFREGWTYNLFDPEDMQRKQQGIMPKAVESKYDLDDPIERYLYEQVLPSDFSKKYQTAEEKENKEAAENAEYNNLYGRFQNELYNEMYKAQQAEYNAAATEGRNPNQITDWESLIASILGKEGYADVAANFYTPKEMETATDYESLADLTSARKSAAKAKENERAFTVEDLIKGYKAADAAARSGVDAEMNSMAPLSFTTEGNVLAQRQDQKKAAAEYDFEAAKQELAFLEKQRERIERVVGQDMAKQYEYAVSPEGQELDQRIKALKREISNMRFAKERYETLSKYEDVTNAADFDQLAAKGAAMDGSQAHRYINDIGKTRERIERGFWDDGVTAFFYEKYDHMTPEEVKVYNATFAKDGEKAAKEYLKALEPILNERTTNARNQMLEGATEKYPVIVNIASVPMAFGKGAGYLYGAVQGIAGEYVDPNSPWMVASSAQGTIRDTTSKDMSPVGQFLYQTGMSIADFAAMAPMGQASLFFMGSGAAADTTRSALERGASQEEALALGTLAGAAEAVFEKVPLDDLANIIAGGGGKSFIATILKQAGVEASEEMLTEIANKLSEAAIMGDLSQYNMLVQEYMAQGMSEEEAKKQASKQTVIDVALAGLGGALSGAVTGSGAYGISMVRNAPNKVDTQRLQNDLQTIGLDNQTANRVISAYSALSDGRIKGAQKTLAKIDETVQNALNKKAEAEAELNVARAEATAKLSPLYNAMQTAIKARDTEAFDKAKQAYVAEYTIQQAKGEAAKVKAEAKAAEANLKVENVTAEAEETVQVQQEQLAQEVIQQAETQWAKRQTAEAETAQNTKKPAGVTMNATQRMRLEQQSQGQEVDDKQLQVLDALGKKYGVSIVLEDSIDREMPDGSVRKSITNGYFDSETGEIHIALDATGEAYMYIAVHELTHYLQEFNDGGYQILEDTVFAALNKDDPGMVDALIKQQMDLFGYDEQRAREEVLANTVPVILQDEAFVRDLVMSDRTLAERILEFFTDLLETLRKAYETLIGESSWTQMELLRQDMDTVGLIADLFNAALEDVRGKQKNEQETITKLSAKDSSSIKEQIRQNAKRISEMEPVAEVRSEGRKRMPKSEQKRVLSDEFKKTGYAVERPNFGKIDIGEKWIDKSLEYINTDAEYAAFFAVPKVLKRGVEISGHENHKQRGHKTFTFAAPVIVNGKTGHMGVVVKQTGSYKYKTHRILSPDGSVFEFNSEKKSEPTSGVGKLPYGNGMAPIGSDNNIISETEKENKKMFSMKDSAGNTLSDQQAEYFKDSKVRNENGNLKVVYHGTGADFTVFSHDYMSQHGSSEGQGFYFTDNRNMAEGYSEGGRLFEGYLDIKNPLSDSEKTMTKAELKKLIRHIDPTGDDVVVNYDSRGGMGYPSQAWYNRAIMDTVNMIWDGSDTDSEILAELANAGAGTETVTKGAKSLLGYDGYIVEGKYDDATVYVAFTSEQAKRIDNKAPTENPDIRFSLKDTSPADIDRLREENQALREANELLRKQFKLTEGRAVSRKAVDELSGKILKAYQSKYDRNTLTDNLIEFYDAVYKAGDDQAKQEEVEAAGAALAKAVLEKSTELDDELYKQYEPLRRMLRETEISLTDRQKQEVAYKYDSYESFRRKNFGRINLKKGGISLDSLWGELSTRYPDLFEPDLAEGEQVEAVVRALDVIKPAYRNPYGYDMDAAAYDLAAQMYNEYFNIPEVRTMADRYAARVKEVQREAAEKIKKARQESRAKYEQRVSEIEQRYKAYRKELLEKYKQAGAEQKQKLNERYKAFVDRKNAKLAERLAANKAPKRITIVRELFKNGVDPVAAEREGKIDHLTSKALQNMYLANGQDMGGRLANNKLDDIMERLDKAKDKSAFGYGRETFLRNMEDMGGREFVDTYATPIRSAVADMTRWQQKWSERIEKLKLNKEESAMVQLVGEGRVGLKELQEGLLFENGKPMDAKRIQEAVKLFRQFYDEALDLANDALLRNGYEKIEGRENYFPHFMESKNAVEKFWDNVIKGKEFALPTEISGMTDIFRPGKRWFKNFKQRLGDNTTYDAVQGFANYLDGVGNVIFLTDSIQRVRQLESAVRGRYSIASENVDVKDKTTHLNNFAAYLLEYGNQLAGKKARVDRAIEEAFGRRMFARLDWLKKRFGANAVGGNISTSISNFIPLTQALATMPKRHFARGMQAAVSRQVRNDGLWEKSDFLTSRFGKPNALFTKPLDIAMNKAGKALNFTFEVVDRFVAETIVFGKYQEGIEKGYSEAKAMRLADEYAERTMAGRSIGSVPTLMNTKTLGIFTQFQLEINNQMSNLLKDIPRWYKGSKRKLIAALVQLFLYSWLYNEINEKFITGRRPAFDPINVVVEAVEDFASGKAGDAVIGLGENLMDQLPFGQLLTNGGRIPLATALSQVNIITPIAKTLNGDENAGKAWRDFSEGLLYNFALPAGGGQAKKIIQGAGTLKRGGRYYDDKLAYPVEDTAGNVISAMLFGPSAVKEGREFYSEEGKALSESKTEKYKSLVEGGMEKQTAYNILNDMPKGNTNAAKLGHIATYDGNDDGKPDLQPEEMNLVAEILGIKASGDIPSKARKEVKKRLKTIEKDEDLTEEEKQKKIEEENLQFFLTILGN